MSARPCPACEHENPEGSRFCNACGAVLQSGCPNCGAENPPQARFCNQCGTDLKVAKAGFEAAASIPEPRSYTPKHLVGRILNSGAAMQGERKHVTVLFADIKGSTALARQAGAETWHRVLDKFFSILTGAVHKYEGTVNQYTGDGIMALFGAPIAHEDHALRACHAALAMHQDLRAYADELRLKQGLNLSMRVGLNSGEVVVGAIGDDLRMDYTARGHVVNLAARMESMAEPGRIYLTRYTQTLVDGYFSLRDLGDIEVKGLEEAVRVYALEGLGELQTRLDVSRRRGLSRFIGRGNEFAQLEQALESAKQGDGQVVAVSGNAGIGKSRLCDEFLQSCEQRGITVHRCHCVPYANAMPYFPVQALFRSDFGIRDSDSADEARRKVAGTVLMAEDASREKLQIVLEFLGIADPDQPALQLSAAQRMERLVEMAQKAIAGLREPCVVLVDDLHWADSGSEDFFEKLAEAVADTPTLLLFNHRPDYVFEWLWKLSDIEIVLHALGDAELKELLLELLGDDESLTELRQHILQRAGGNPYFVEEAVRSLAETGQLEGVQGAYIAAAPLADLKMPETVHAILAARIDRLEPQHKAVLQVAAVIGKEFTEERLVRVSDLESEATVEALRALEEAGFVHPEGMGKEAGIVFCHPLMQEAAYTSQLGEQRERIHANLAEQIEGEFEDGLVPDERSVLLAHHWRKAKRPIKAAHWMLRSAAWVARHDIDGVLERFRRAIELLEDAPDTEESRHLKISARAGVVRTAIIVRVPKEEIEQRYREASELAEQTGDRQGLAELLVAHASILLQQGDADAATEATAKAMQIAVELGDRDLQARFRIPILFAYYSAGRLQQGLDAMAYSSDAGWESEPISIENFASRAFRANMIAVMGRLPEARRETERAIEVAGEQGRLMSWMHANLVDISYLIGEGGNAARDARLAVSHAEEFGSPLFREIAYRSLAQAYIINAEYRAALQILEKSVESVRPDGLAHQFESAHFLLVAEALLGAGEARVAVEQAREAVACGARSHSRIWQLRALIMLARCLREAEGVAAEDEIEDSLEAATALIDETGAVTLTPFVARERALLAAACERPEAAQSFWEEALEGFQEIGANGHARAASQRIETPQLQVG